MGRVRNKKENKHGCVCPMIGDGHEYKIVQRFFLFGLHLCSSVFMMQEDLFGVKFILFGDRRV
jgi:hypothetical protein